MTATGEERINRILVALDTSAHGRAALEAAIDLAAVAGAQVLGLFVEDTNLLRLASLPFARELEYSRVSERDMDRQRMERTLKAEAEQIRLGLALAATRRRVQWSFRVARGRVAEELLAATVEADLVILGRAGRHRAYSRRMGSTAQALLAHAARSVALSQQGCRLGGPVVALYQGGASSRRALSLAAALAARGRLLVLVPGGPAVDTARLEQEAREWLRAAGLDAVVRTGGATDAPELASQVRREGGGLLVLPGDHALTDAATDSLLANLPCPLVLAR
jgi:nucleotide-binding universal stress UspA family protein